MKKIKEKVWVLCSLIWITISVSSLFISIISYRGTDGITVTYALQDLLDGDRFSKEVLSQYTGDFRLEIGSWGLTVLCILAVAAIFAASIGILILGNQKPVKWPYIMTLLGLIGTAIPSVAVFVAVIASISYFPGTITCGFYPIITPIAMLICFVTVKREHSRVLRAVKASHNVDNLILPAGDLSSPRNDNEIEPQKRNGVASKKKRAIKITIVILVIIAAMICIFAVVLPAYNYAQARKLFQSGDYLEAKSAFAQLGDYRDSATQVKECNYQEALALLAAGDYEAAKTGFASLKDYPDCMYRV